MEHDQSSYFSRGPDDFCWGPAPVGSTLVTGAGRNLRNDICMYMDVPSQHPGFGGLPVSHAVYASCSRHRPV